MSASFQIGGIESFFRRAKKVDVGDINKAQKATLGFLVRFNRTIRQYVQNRYLSFSEFLAYQNCAVAIQWLFFSAQQDNAKLLSSFDYAANPLLKQVCFFECFIVNNSSSKPIWIIRSSTQFRTEIDVS